MSSIRKIPLISSIAMSATTADQSERLFREYRDRLTRFAIHLVGAGADADDLVQETFLKAHHHLCNGREIRAPLSFLFVTMRNLVNDAYRRGVVAPAETPLDADAAAPGDDVPSVERQVMSEREFEALCAAIAQLPERMRYAFVLRKVYGYSCREIAQHLGRSTNTVREQVAQSFRKLEALKRDERKTRAGRRRAEAPERDDLPIFNVPLPSRE
jgi:RNA polymerase sigma factor (sigma-70 family)